MYPGKWAVLTPDKPAAINSDTGATISFQDLEDRSNRLARLFRARGLRPGNHIALFLENDIRFFEVAWAALRSGLYLTTVNRYLTAEEAAYIVNDCGARALISSRRLAGAAREIPPRAHRTAGFCSPWTASMASRTSMKRGTGTLPIPWSASPAVSSCSTVPAPPAGPRASSTG